MHRRRSPSITFSANDVSRSNGRRHAGAALQSRTQLLQGRSLGHFADFPQEVIGKRHPCQGGPGLEPPMQGVGHIADLNHGSHAKNMKTCAMHVKLSRHGPPIPPRRGGWVRRPGGVKRPASRPSGHTFLRDRVSGSSSSTRSCITFGVIRPWSPRSRRTRP